MYRVPLQSAAIFTGLILLIPAQVGAQRGSSGTAASAGSAGSLGTSSTLGTGSTNRNSTTNNTTNNTGTLDQSRPIFLAGSVLFDDGTPPNTDVRIERVCGGNPHLESHSDSHGHFSFQLGGAGNFDLSAADASSSSSSNSSFGMPGSNGSSASGNSRGSSGYGGMSFFDCELRAAYPGYMSDMVELSTRRSLDDPNVGTIVLHRLANVKGTTISLTSALAPKSAQKSFQKGMQLAQKGKFEEAETKFQEATKDYPKYAEAWFELGEMQVHLNQDPAAAYLAAISADAKYVSPYDKLARLRATQNNWKEAADYSKQALDLNPVEFPSSFWYNAIANYNLKNDIEAQKSANSLVKLDRAHHYPEAERLLADIAVAHHDLPDAANHLKAFLAIAPNASNTDEIKTQLARIEEVQAAQAKTAPAPVGGSSVLPPPQ